MPQCFRLVLEVSSFASPCRPCATCDLHRFESRYAFQVVWLLYELVRQVLSLAHQFIVAWIASPMCWDVRQVLLEPSSSPEIPLAGPANGALEESSLRRVLLVLVDLVKSEVAPGGITLSTVALISSAYRLLGKDCVKGWLGLYSAL